MSQAYQLILFTQMTDKQFEAAVEWFTSRGAAVRDRYRNMIANGLRIAYETGNYDPINRIAAASRAFGCYRMFQRIMLKFSIGPKFTLGLMCWDYNPETEQFFGKADKAKLEALRKLTTYEDSDGVAYVAAKWEVMLRKAFDAEEIAEKAASKSPFNLEQRALAFARACVKNRIPVADAETAFHNALQKAVAS